MSSETVEEAIATLATFRQLSTIAPLVGTTFPDDPTIDRAIGFMVTTNIGRLLGDLSAVADAMTSVQTQNSSVDGCGARLACAWSGAAGSAAGVAVDDHARSRGEPLSALNELAASSTSARAGLVQLLDGVVRALEVISQPAIEGHLISAIPSALASGEIKASVVAAEIDTRTTLFDAATNAGRDGLHDILAALVGGLPPAEAASSGDLALAGEQ